MARSGCSISGAIEPALTGDPASIRVRLIRAALALAPGTWNPAWRYGDVVRAELGPSARIAVDPRQVLGKIGMRTMNGLKRRFLVPGLGAREFRPIAELPTYRDVEDFAAHGDDYRATRLYRWLKQSADEGMPVLARGIVCDTEQRMLDYYFTYLDLFRNLEQRGEAEKVGKKLDGQSFTVLRQASESGQLYGSVSPRDIAVLVVEKGFNVDRNQIALNTPIKTIGIHKVPISLHPEVDVTISLAVARNADEAARLARGEDITVARTEEQEAAAAALANAEAFFEPEVLSRQATDTDPEAPADDTK